MNQAFAEPKDTQELESYAIGFRVRTEEYGLMLQSVREIVTTPQITRVPKSPKHVLGVINLHGNVVPVLDIARRFGIGEATLTVESKVVVVEDGTETVGILAESVGKVIRIRRSELRPPPPLVAGIAAEFLDSILRSNDHFVVFFNLAKTLEERNVA